MWGWWLCTRYSRRDARSQLGLLSIPGRYYVFRHCDCFFYTLCTHQRGSFVSCLLIIQFCSQSIYSFFSLCRRKPSIAFGNLWSILFYCGILGDGRWLVFPLNTRSLISYSWSAFCFLWKCYVSRHCWCVLLRVFARIYFLALFSVKDKSAEVVCQICGGREYYQVKPEENWKTPLPCLKVLCLWNKNSWGHRKQIVYFTTEHSVTNEDTAIYSTRNWWLNNTWYD